MSQNKPKNYNLPAYINIPLFLYQDESLDRTALLLAAFIYSLHTAGKVINVKNNYLSQMLKIHERKVQSNLELLEQKGYLMRIGLGSNRQIKWVFCPESKINVQELNDHADNGTLPTTAPQPRRQRHPYNKDNTNQDNIYISEPKKLKPVEYQETYYDAQPVQEHLASEVESNRTFEDFWSLYPVKKDKKKAKAAWFSQQCYKQVDLILEKLARQIKEDSQFIDGYIMNPAKYIMGERWNDEIQRRKVKNKAHSFDLDSTEWASKFHEDIF